MSLSMAWPLKGMTISASLTGEVLAVRMERGENDE